MDSEDSVDSGPNESTWIFLCSLIFLFFLSSSDLFDPRSGGAASRVISPLSMPFRRVSRTIRSQHAESHSRTLWTLNLFDAVNVFSRTM